ncbi:hypothetical protein P2318_32435 [Myxococcaceae bacterium GXIMD 01537]
MSPEAPDQLPLFDAPALETPERPRPPSREEALPHAADLAHRLSRELGTPVHLTLTDNRTTFLSFHRHPDGLQLRVHHLFLHAPDAVVQALAAYAGRGEEEAQAVLEAHIRERSALVRRERHAPLRSRGRCFDLRAVYAHLNATYFEGALHADIGWGRRPGHARRKSIHLGLYDARLNEIRVHPALDAPHVPAFVVEHVVFHAMLHQLFPDPPGSRQCSHPPGFRERERAFPRLETALRWQHENLSSLLRR